MNARTSTSTASLLSIPLGLLFASLLLAAFVNAETTILDDQNWQLLWSDEFHGNSLNSSFWTPRVGFLGFNAEFQTYSDSPENLYVQDGKLNIAAVKDSRAQVGYTSARINTQDKIQFKYAMLEASIKLPSPMSMGLWPAFWTLGETYPEVGWPAAGEIDILEAGQKQGSSVGLGNRRIVSAFHWEAFGNYAQENGHLDLPYDLSEGFHQYKMVWQPDYIATYVDNHLVYKFRIDYCDRLWDCVQEFHQYHYMILNIAVAGLFACCEYGFELNDAPNGAAWIMQVDYVRLYGNSNTEVLLPDGSLATTPQPLEATAPSPITRQAPTMKPTPESTMIPTGTSTDTTIIEKTQRPTDAPSIEGTEGSTMTDTDGQTAQVSEGAAESPVPISTHGAAAAVTMSPTGATASNPASSSSTPQPTTSVSSSQTDEQLVPSSVTPSPSDNEDTPDEAVEEPLMNSPGTTTLEPTTIVTGGAGVPTPVAPAEPAAASPQPTPGGFVAIEREPVAPTTTKDPSPQSAPSSTPAPTMTVAALFSTLLNGGEEGADSPSNRPSLRPVAWPDANQPTPLPQIIPRVPTTASPVTPEASPMPVGTDDDVLDEFLPLEDDDDGGGSWGSFTTAVPSSVSTSAGSMLDETEADGASNYAVTKGPTVGYPSASPTSSTDGVIVSRQEPEGASSSAREEGGNEEALPAGAGDERESDATVIDNKEEELEATLQQQQREPQTSSGSVPVWRRMHHWTCLALLLWVR